MDIQKIINDVVAKLKADPALVKNFIADPVKTLEKTFHIDLRRASGLPHSAPRTTGPSGKQGGWPFRRFLKGPCDNLKNLRAVRLTFGDDGLH